ncbi:MAG: 2-iminoacetate synthase ThiH [Pseudomonadota bacterium]
MSFLETLDKLDVSELRDTIHSVSEQDVAHTLSKQSFSIMDLKILISPAASFFLEEMATRAQKITLLRFGRTVKLYAPLYVSNECVNACTYCGFNMRNKIDRITLTLEEIIREADALYDYGFRHILLVSGEDKNKVPIKFLEDIARELSKKFAAISIEIYPLDTNDYKKLVTAGVTGIAIYQETYNRDVYKTLHKGPKADFNYRLLSTERAGEAGFRDMGIGALLGLTDFRVDMTCVAFHAAFLMKHFWKSQISISFPRMRTAAGGFSPPFVISDKELAQIIFALRIVLPDVDLVLSTREKAEFRDGMAGIGITRMSAGSRTNPGGYALADDTLEQFKVADSRTPAEVAVMLEQKNLEPVWKDFDRSFLFE